MAAPGANTPLTLANAMFDCGITDDILFDGDTKASRIATELLTTTSRRAWIRRTSNYIMT